MLQLLIQQVGLVPIVVTGVVSLVGIAACCLVVWILKNHPNARITLLGLLRIEISEKPLPAIKSIWSREK